ncbi:MAG: GTPase Era [Lachnospiraceae bacterium]|nr:GTPase Era [Lachnospiraceae bacterium]
MRNDVKKSGYVSIIGRSNVGKSTLMNHLIGQKIAITANKPQTTRNRIQTVYTDVRGQIVYLDTPGLHKAKNRLGEFMVEEALHTIPDADVVLWIVEADPFIGRFDLEIGERLKQSGKPVILVVNKTDLVEKQTVKDAVKAYEALMTYRKIIAVSALRSVNTGKVTDAIFECLPEGPMYFDEDTVTDQPMRQIVAEMVREKALRILEEEIPHGIAVTTDSMKQRKNGLWDIEATIVCEKESHKGIIIGKGGAMLKRIGAQARMDAEKMLEDRVNLKLYVKVRENWRDSDILLKNYGYTAPGKDA